MERQQFPGTYRDAQGGEYIRWQLQPVTGTQGYGTFDVCFSVRGVEVRGADLDSLEAVDRRAAEAAGLTMYPDSEAIVGCVLAGVLPVTVQVDGHRDRADISFAIDLRDGGGHWPLQVSLELQDTVYEVVEQSIEDGLRRLEAALPPGVTLVSCHTCRWSTFQPYSWSVLGMRCHRDAREEALAGHGKHAIAAVPVIEWVPATYLCSQYERQDATSAQPASGGHDG
jgi:hypothetical protein